MDVSLGFKEIEVGFPAASETEYEFLRTLIEKNMIPADVTVQVLTQCRDHIIRRTFEAVKGAPRAVIHFYNSTSVAQREQVFHKSKEEIKQIAVDGAKLVKQLSEEYEGNFLFEYSPESFTGTEVDYAVEVCNAVLDIMQPTPERPMIINLPVTVEMSMPHVYANQIEYCDKHLKYRDSVIISTHPHNDRGTGVACAELAVLAGAQRVECCLFGNGERTGNVDAVTLAMNMYSHGVDPKLDFSDMPAICATYERVTRMHIYERTPYAGQLVFAAFSGSHQDAIAKGMAYRNSSLLPPNSSLVFFPFFQCGKQAAQADVDGAKVGDLVNFQLGVQLAAFLQNFAGLVGGNGIQAAAEGYQLHQVHIRLGGAVLGGRIQAAVVGPLV